MNKYQKGLIYKIYSKSQPELVYYGATINLIKRKSHHFSKYCSTSSKIIIDKGDAICEKIEDYPCNSAKELRLREKYFIDNFPCVNLKSNVPEDEIQYKKDKDLRCYYNTKKYVTCECGRSVMVRLLKRHKQSNIHKSLILAGQESVLHSPLL